MKTCKIVHINDGNPFKIHNENRLFVEEYAKAEEVLNSYIAEGWEVKHIIPEYDPAMLEGGNGLTFYHTGICVYMEKELH